jgi:hypothetical protein
LCAAAVLTTPCTGRVHHLYRSWPPFTPARPTPHTGLVQPQHPLLGGRRVRAEGRAGARRGTAAWPPRVVCDRALQTGPEGALRRGGRDESCAGGRQALPAVAQARQGRGVHGLAHPRVAEPLHGPRAHVARAHGPPRRQGRRAARLRHQGAPAGPVCAPQALFCCSTSGLRSVLWRRSCAQSAPRRLRCAAHTFCSSRSRLRGARRLRGS